jgi:hypothetical protein
MKTMMISSNHRNKGRNVRHVVVLLGPMSVGHPVYVHEAETK